METRSALTPSPDNAVVWYQDRLYLLDQRHLPERAELLPLSSAAATARAIADMVVRGAPAIGIAAAYGVVLAARDAYARRGGDWRTHVEGDLALLAASRPTAMNLFWAIERMKRSMDALGRQDPVPALLDEALAIHTEDRAANRAMGELGAELIQGPTDVITHCNAGALATGGYGTALGVIRSAFAAGRIGRVYADETRPWMQGSRLTAWELVHEGIPVTVQADGAAAGLMAAGGIGWVIVGSDRIAANGDVANKIGTYALAVLARYHGVGLMVAAPTSTVDMRVKSGSDIPIEERDPEEVLACGGRRLGPEGVGARNPVFDVTPAALVDVIVTEKGVVASPTLEKMRALMEEGPDAPAKAPKALD
jgi:methylthioribose-1-phosphate isomerase